MSRAERRRHDRARQRPSSRYVTVAVHGYASTDEGLDDVRQMTHDAVIELTGTARRSGVRWVWFKDDEALIALAEQAAANGRDPLADDADHLIYDLLKEHGGYLVVAMVEVAR